MGLIRKAVSLSTLGIVPFRNRQERQYRVAKQTRNAARAMVVQQGVGLNLQRDQYAATIQIAAQQAAAMGLDSVPAGWYQDPRNTRYEIFWDGETWIMQTRRLTRQRSSA
jgi:hypothetical protein